jgi:hypothetical protein
MEISNFIFFPVSLLPCVTTNCLFACAKSYLNRINHIHFIQTIQTIQTGNGGGKRDRTDDLLLAKQALSQLSYTPVISVHLFYTKCKSKNWWAWVDLNYRPHAYQACALTN